MASTDQVLNLMNTAARFALEQSADQLLAEVKAFIPIFTSDLRDAHVISSGKTNKRTGISTVRIKNTLPYARFQYFRKLFHPTRGGKLTRMTEVGAVGGVGLGGTARYGAAYRSARKANKLQKFAAEWFSTQKVNDPKVKRRVSLRFANAFARRL